MERREAPKGRGPATRTDVAPRSRFGRGARHRTIRLREPPASGARRLPALHCGSSPRLSTATAPNRAHPIDCPYQEAVDARARLDSLATHILTGDKCQGMRLTVEA